MLQELEEPATNLSETKKENSRKDGKYTPAANPLSHATPLESHDRIPQNQRHNPRDADARAQKNPKHAEIHATHSI